jgi:hypothetical protein
MAEITPLSPLARSLYELSVDALFNPANGQLTAAELHEQIRSAWQRRHADEIAGREDEATWETFAEMQRWLSITAIPVRFSHSGDR